MPRFHTHVNRELGNKKFYSSKDYVAAMKSAGLEPYKEGSAKREPVKEYKRSEWANSMLQDISSRKGRPPGDKFIKELEKRGYTQKRADEARRLANGR